MPADVRVLLLVLALAARCSESRESRSARGRRLYDRGCLFSPEGRIYQVEYAQCAVERGGAAAAVVGKGCVIVGALRSQTLRAAPRALLPARDDGFRERVHRIDEHVICVASGVAPDARQLVRALQRTAQDHRRTWGTAAPVELIALQLCDLLQQTTQRAGGRPFGAGFIIAGHDAKFGMQCYKTDASGAYDSWRAALHRRGVRASKRPRVRASERCRRNASMRSCGAVDDETKEHFECSFFRFAASAPATPRLATNYRDGLAEDEATDLVLGVLRASSDRDAVDAADYEVAVLRLDAAAQLVSKILSTEDIRALFIAREARASLDAPPDVGDAVEAAGGSDEDDARGRP
ncbi:nucleophile aminohydrolase [Pelagophyceae sp. CCMP2097]|nr:nucleophile aminohydrolase [Pelagophyceae sp. CCMP2097]